MATAPDAGALLLGLPNDEGPKYHVCPAEGWLNDPNGLVFYSGHYHLFYQHVERGCDWEWGLVWGHAVSKDLVHWQRLPPALRPTPGSADADGCWSGCCSLDSSGRPALLYTGVRLHSTPVQPGAAPAASEGCGVQVGRLPAPDDGAGPLWTETQCMATLKDPGDELLLCWRKSPQPILPPPPPVLPLLGWRDPFIYQRPNAEQGGAGLFRLIVGCGIKGMGWEALGVMCSAADVPSNSSNGSSSSTELGQVWECPLLAPLPGSGGRWLLAVSPYPCQPPNSPSNPVLCFVSSLDASTGRFDMQAAECPIRLDLGDCLYAPNVCMNDPAGRLLLWAWLEEKRQPGTIASYSGCLTLPRLLSWEPGLGLVQQPLPELQRLRKGSGWHARDLEISPGSQVVLGGSSGSVSGQQVEVRLSLRRGTASSAGLRLQCYAAGERGDAILSYSWEAHNLAVSFMPPNSSLSSSSSSNNTAVVAGAPETILAELAEPLKEAAQAEADAAAAAAAHYPAAAVSGQLAGQASDSIELTVFIDSSAVEVFTGTGQVLTTRVYRGQAPAHAAGCGISLVAAGGTAVADSVSAWELGSIWKGEDLAEQKNTV